MFVSVRIQYDAKAPNAAIELQIRRPLPDYDLEEIEAQVPRDVDPMLASQGFHDLLDEARNILARVLDGSGLEVAQLTGAISRKVTLMPDELINSEYLTYEGLCKLLGMRRGTLYSLVSRGQIPFTRLTARIVRFHKPTILKWLANRAVSPKSEDHREQPSARA